MGPPAAAAAGAAAVDGEAQQVVAVDARGRVLVWSCANDKEGSLQGKGRLLVFPLRHALAGGFARPEEAVQLLELNPSLPFNVHSIALNRDDQRLLLASSSEGRAGVGIVELLHEPSAASSQPTQPSKCRTVLLAAEFFRVRPALRVLQASWHPLSDVHVVVLTSDSVLRIFNVLGDAETPEQEYRLQSNARSSQPVAFAFSDASGWDRFTIFLVYGNGSIYTLCPVVPWGVWVPRAELKALVRNAPSDDDDDADRQAEVADWCQLAFPSVVDGSANTELVQAVPHAFEQMSPVLQGPLAVHCRDAQLKDALGANMYTHASGLLLASVSDVTAVVVAAQRAVRVLLLGDSVLPTWSRPKPALVIARGQLVSVSAAPAIELDDRSPPLVLVNVIQLPSSNAGKLHLLPDAAMPERFYCRQSQAVHSVVLPWLVDVAGEAVESDDDDDEAPELLPPSVECLFSSQNGDRLLTGAAVVLSPLADERLVCLTGSDELVALEPSVFECSDLLHADQNSNGAEQMVAVHQEALRRELLRGPPSMKLPPMPSGNEVQDVRTLEGRKHLHECSKLLREKYVQHLYHMHTTIQTLAKQMAQEVATQKVRRKRLQQTATALLEESDRLNSSVQRAIERHNNALQRFQILKELAWRRTRPLTDKEKELKELLNDTDAQLPSLQSKLVELQLRSDNVFTHKLVPPVRQRTQVADAQMEKLQKAITAEANLLSDAMDKVQRLQLAVDQMERRSDLA
eukprot:jgi/Chlat1/201/Chrsp1S08776